MKLNLILLAAGTGQRFGSDKLKHYIEGYPMYMHAVMQVMRLREMPEGASVNKVVVVTAESLAAEEVCAYGVGSVINGERRLGISTSVRAGVRSCSDGDAYMFLVCDQPWLRAETLAQMIRAYKGTRKGIMCAADNRKRGNPCMFDFRYRDELLKLSGDRGGSQIIKKHPEDVEYYQVADSKELADVDTKDQIRR